MGQLFLFLFILTFNNIRYSDFIVNEVDLEGKAVHLTSLEAPPEVYSLLSFFLIFDDVPLLCCLCLQ